MQFNIGVRIFILLVLPGNSSDATIEIVSTPATTA